MPHPSMKLQVLADQRNFDEIYELTRIITFIHEEKNLNIKVEIRRYYTESGYHYHLEYIRENEDGDWIGVNYGQVLTDSESEEVAISTAIFFIKEAHGIK